jgi:hypothetical protein
LSEKGNKKKTEQINKSKTMTIQNCWRRNRERRKLSEKENWSNWRQKENTNGVLITEREEEEVIFKNYVWKTGCGHSFLQSLHLGGWDHKSQSSVDSMGKSLSWRWINNNNKTTTTKKQQIHKKVKHFKEIRYLMEKHIRKDKSKEIV